MAKEMILKVNSFVVDGACLRGMTAHSPAKRWHLPTPFSSVERDFLLRPVPKGDGRLAGVSPVTHHSAFYEKLFERYEEVKEKLEPKELKQWERMLKEQHGVLIRLASLSPIPMDMTFWHLDRFHAITTIARGVVIATLVKVLVFRSSFSTAKAMLKRVRVAKGGGLWLRVMFRPGRDPQIVGDAGDMLSFSTTPPEEILGGNNNSYSFNLRI